MKRFAVSILVPLLLILTQQSLKAQTDDGLLDEWAAVKARDIYPSFFVEEWDKMHLTKQDQLEVFQDLKYGMFIHFSAYSETAGFWDGKKIEEFRSARHVDWIMLAAKVPRDEYVKLFPRFNPVDFNAEDIVKLAKAAGMRYIVITSKHHDGFAMFETSHSKYNIMDATPFRRDIIRELHDACQKHGILFGVYYSHNIDWLEGSDSQVEKVRELNLDIGHPNIELAANTWDPSPNTFQEYLDQKAIPQVHELVTNYPSLFCIWYDLPWRMKPEQSFKFYKIPYKINPGVLISGRVGHGFGDYHSPRDNEVPPASETIHKPWETCGTLNNSWAYKSYDHDWKTPKEVLYWLVDIASKGGNYLLNIGPDGRGVVPEPAIRNLVAVGRWLEENGEAIYGTRRWEIVREGSLEEFNIEGTADRQARGFQDNFTPEDFWFTRNDQNLFAICLATPGRDIFIRSFQRGIGRIRNVEVLGAGKVKFTQTKKGLKVQMPKDLDPDPGFVVKVSF